MDHLLLLLLLWSSEFLRLVGGATHCSGVLQLNLGEWIPVDSTRWTLKEAAAVCSNLNCGSLSLYLREWSSDRTVTPSSPSSDLFTLELTCADSVRLVNGTNQCSGRLEVKSDQSDQWWPSVCEADFDQQDAEVVCRELGCGAPSVLQGGLYGAVEAPRWSCKEFQCEGHESALLDCRSSDSATSSCSPVGLTCSEPVRLVGGASRCSGVLQVKLGEWRPVDPMGWDLKESAVICRELNCGSAVSIGRRESPSDKTVWITPDCVRSGLTLRECILSFPTSPSQSALELTCADSVRLVNGTDRCSGRLEVKSDQSDQWWPSVCEADFDQQDAEVVCRELGCGAPSVLQGGLYGAVEAPRWSSKEFQCEGHESALLDCRSSDSARSSCSPVGLTCSEPVRLVGGASRCSGVLQVELREWKPVDPIGWTLKEAAVICRELNCGSAVSIGISESPSEKTVKITPDCVLSGLTLRECIPLYAPYSDSFTLELTCADSVRLVNGTGQCSGRLEVKSDQSDQWWPSVCEADFDQQDAEVVCRELGCGAPSVLQGGLYGAVEAPRWSSKEFQCEGHESALLDCRSSDSATSSCSPVGLTCSEPVRLVGGASRCSGVLQVKLGEWKPVSHIGWPLWKSAVICRELNCGSAVTTGISESPSEKTVKITPDCVRFGLPLRECIPLSAPYSDLFTLELTCADSVRLVNGTGRCSGRLEVKSDQSDQWWPSVCEADFDQQDAEVVCRELGCGAPSVLQGGLYGAVEAPRWSSKEFQCEGHESALLDCRSSDSATSSCSPVGLTCSEPVRLVGGASRCSGVLQVKLGEWKPVSHIRWTLKEAAAICRELNCGSAVSIGRRESPSDKTVTSLPACVGFGLTLRECIPLSAPYSDLFALELTCADSVRLVNGTGRCSGRLEVKSDQSDQWWPSVCEADFDQQDAEVVCRELGCGAPSVLQGGLYGAVEAPRWSSKEFQCEGHESALLDCRSSDSATSSCSPVGLTCSELVRLVGGASRCSGVLQVELGEWRPVGPSGWDLKEATVVCRELNCGSAVSTGPRESPSNKTVWITGDCVLSGLTLRECILPLPPFFSPSTLELTCSDLLVQPVISPSSSVDRVSEAQQQRYLHVFMGSSFTISCSIQPQYPGGLFKLTFTSSSINHTYTQLAVNHSTTFLFPASELDHQGSYSCVYHIYVFSHNFSSESLPLSLTVTDPTGPLIRLVVLPLTLLLVIAIMSRVLKANRGQRPGPQEARELDSYNLGDSRIEGEPDEEEGVQAAELDL